jgi:hypothetical protein
MSVRRRQRWPQLIRFEENIMAHKSSLIPMALIAALVWTGTAQAQPHPIQPVEEWSGIHAGARVHVVTTAEPTRRQDCHVQHFDADKIICSRSFGRTVAFQKDGVVAVMTTRKNALATFLTNPPTWLSAVAFTGAVFLGPISLLAAIPIIVVSSGTMIASAVDASERENEEPHLLYQAPGSTLQVSVE